MLLTFAHILWWRGCFFRGCHYWTVCGGAAWFSRESCILGVARATGAPVNTMVSRCKSGGSQMCDRAVPHTLCRTAAYPGIAEVLGHFAGRSRIIQVVPRCIRDYPGRCPAESRTSSGNHGLLTASKQLVHNLSQVGAVGPALGHLASEVEQLRACFCPNMDSRAKLSPAPIKQTSRANTVRRAIL